MANRQHPGLLPAQSVGAGFARRRWIVASNASTIRKGDAVAWGGAAMAVATVTTTGIAGASIGAVYKNSLGEIVESAHLPASETYSTSGFDPVDGNFIYLPEDQVNTIYVGSCDEALANTDMNLNYALVLATTTSVVSDHEIDATGRNTTATLPVRLIGPVLRPDIDPDAADAWFYCRVNAGFIEPALTTTGS